MSCVCACLRFCVSVCLRVRVSLCLCVSVSLCLFVCACIRACVCGRHLHTQIYQHSCASYECTRTSAILVARVRTMHAAAATLPSPTLATPSSVATLAPTESPAVHLGLVLSSMSQRDCVRRREGKSTGNANTLTKVVMWPPRYLNRRPNSELN